MVRQNKNAEISRVSTAHGMRYGSVLSISFFRMIDSLAYRVSIGRWHASILGRSPRSWRKAMPRGIRCKTYLLYALILSAHIILGAYQSSQTNSFRSMFLTREHGSAQPVFLKEIADFPMTRRLLSKLLEIGGVELNPGPSRAMNSTDDRPLFMCSICKSQFTRRANMLNHRRNRHVNAMAIRCRLCGQESADLQQWESHMVSEHKPRTKRWKIINSAFKARVFELAFMYDSTDSLEEALGQGMMNAVKNQIKFYRRLHGQIKYSMTFGALMRRELLEETHHETFFFQSEEKSAVRGEYGIDEEIQDSMDLLRRRVLDLEVSQEGSGWSFEAAEVFSIKIVKLGSKKMGRHLAFTPRNKHGNKLKIHLKNTVNVKNEDNYCAIYNIVLSVFGDSINGNPEEPKNLEKYLKYINWDGVNFPVEGADLLTLEMNNKTELNIAINVWRFLSVDHIEPFYISRNISRGHVNCDMLLIEGKSPEGREQTSHLVHIRDRAALFRPSYDGGQQHRKHPFFCPTCKLYRSESMMKMEQHFKRCTNQDYVEKVLPPAVDEFFPNGNIIALPSSYRSSPPILRGFMDFETSHRKIPPDFCQRCHSTLQGLNCNSDVEIYCQHKQKKQSLQLTQLPAVTFSLLIVDQDNKKVYERYYEGEDAGREFARLLIREEAFFHDYIDKNAQMKMSAEDVLEFEEAAVCVCGKVFSSEILKCRDHDHYTGERDDGPGKINMI